MPRTGLWEPYLHEIQEASREGDDGWQAGVQLMGTMLPGLKSLRGHCALSGPGQVGSEMPRGHSTHNQEVVKGK